jgi:predicted nucleic acid-binding protein
MERLLDERNAAASVQVLKGFYAVATGKVREPLPRREAIAVIRDLRHACRVIDDTLPQLERALDLMISYSLSIWDASVIAAAEAAGCGELYSEDFVHGAKVGGVRITNPLR